tara:strand:- start:2612 stop:3250 length:639 start_codon:yes stop_codon:yes gene_type:complete
MTEEENQESSEEETTDPKGKEESGTEQDSEKKETETSEKEDSKEEAPEKEEAGDETPSGSEKKSDDDAAPKGNEETAEDLLKSDLDGVKIRKAKKSKNISSGICHVLATFNNTKVTFSDPKGNVISWSSSGKCNFRGSRKSTAYAAQVVTQDAGRAAMSHGMKEVVVKVKGPGMGRDSAVRTLQSLGFIVTSIVDVTPVPHNGCRPPKRRRV